MKLLISQRLVISGLLATVCALLVFEGSSQAASDVIPVVRNEAQLFIDDELIESSVDLERTLHRPRKDNGGRMPVIRARPGTTLLAYGTIVYDLKLKRHVMFVQEFPSRNMYRFTSVDGLTWDPAAGEPFDQVRFDLDLQTGEGAKGHRGIDLFSCYYNVWDTSYPYQGWLYFANCGFDHEGIYFVRSRDGKVWERGRQVVNAWAGPGDPSARVIQQDGKTVYGPGDVTLFSYDPVGRRFLGIFKFFTIEKVGPGNGIRSRAYAFLDRLDQPVDTSHISRIALLPPVAPANGDTSYDEYYASTAWRYESVWLGGLKIFHQQGDYPHSSAGCAFLKLVVSRDGLNWSKVSCRNDAGVPEVFIPNGPEGGEQGLNDGGYISEFSQGPLRIDDEIVYYYSASSFGKNHTHDQRLRGGGIFRARLRKDGFVSVDRGTMTTRPLAFDGVHLLVNSVGPVGVELVGKDDQVVGRADLTGDQLTHPVAFGGKSLREAAPGGVVRLRFAVHQGGQLYSFTIR